MVSIRFPSAYPFTFTGRSGKQDEGKQFVQLSRQEGEAQAAAILGGRWPCACLVAGPHGDFCDGWQCRWQRGVSRSLTERSTLARSPLAWHQSQLPLTLPASGQGGGSDTR